MREEIGIGKVSLRWMGQLHSRSYQRLFDHYPEYGVKPRLVIATTVEGGAEGAGA